MVVESGNHGESDDTGLTPDEATQLINKRNHAQPPSITGLALLRTIDFWILFSIMSLCKCPFIGQGVVNRTTPVTGVGIMCKRLHSLREGG